MGCVGWTQVCEWRVQTAHVAELAPRVCQQTRGGETLGWFPGVTLDSELEGCWGGPHYFSHLESIRLIPAGSTGCFPGEPLLSTALSPPRPPIHSHSKD